MPAGLSRAVTVYRAHFAVDLGVTIRFAKDGIRVCLRILSCVCATRKQRPGRYENYKGPSKHLPYLDLVGTQVKLSRVHEQGSASNEPDKEQL
jgi:hypothetical protein